MLLVGEVWGDHTSPTSSNIFVAPVNQKDFTTPQYRDFAIEHNSGVFATANGRQDYTMPPSSHFSVAPDSKDNCPDFVVPAYSNFLYEPDYDFVSASGFRRDVTILPESSVVPYTRPAYSNMSTITYNKSFWTQCSIGEYSYDIF